MALLVRLDGRGTLAVAESILVGSGDHSDDCLIDVDSPLGIEFVKLGDGFHGDRGKDSPAFLAREAGGTATASLDGSGDVLIGFLVGVFRGAHVLVLVVPCWAFRFVDVESIAASLGKANRI